jgi:hypothetical protein
VKDGTLREESEMKTLQIHRRASRPMKAALLLSLIAAAALLRGREASAQVTHPGHDKEGSAGKEGLPRIPESMRIEHAELHEALSAATGAPGAVGEAARRVAAVLHPHFVREEEIALPPLGLLPGLARGDAVTEEMAAAVLPMTDALRAELAKMLEEHGRISAALDELARVARAGGQPEHAALAEKIQLHARTEEEVTYPAALLVGEMVRAKRGR